MKYNTPSISKAAGRLVRIVERAKLASPSNARRKVKRFQHIATSMARAYRAAGRSIAYTRYDATYKAKAVKSMMRYLQKRG